MITRDVTSARRPIDLGVHHTRLTDEETWSAVADEISHLLRLRCLYFLLCLLQQDLDEEVVSN